MRWRFVAQVKIFHDASLVAGSDERPEQTKLPYSWIRCSCRLTSGTPFERKRTVFEDPLVSRQNSCSQSRFQDSEYATRVLEVVDQA